jgi:hypothetical protein
MKWWLAVDEGRNTHMIHILGYPQRVVGGSLRFSLEERLWPLEFPNERQIVGGLLRPVTFLTAEGPHPRSLKS